MGATTIADLWVPQIWIRGTDEKARSLPSLVTSGAVTRSPVLDQAASGGGLTVNLPFFKDISDLDEGIQVEGTAPGLNNLTSGQNVAPTLNREIAYGSNALAAGVSGDDPVGGITAQIALSRQKRTQKAILNVLRGLFYFAGTPGAAAGALLANRYDKFSETGASPSAPNLITANWFNNAAALLGELQGDLMGGAIWVHPDIRAALRNQDEIAFEKASKGEFMIETYRGIPIYTSNLLVRAGTTSGYVYDTYLLASGAIGWGEKPQTDGVDVASLQYYRRPDLNQDQIFDRRRYLVHVNGTKFTGSPAGQSATNAELATYGNWSLQFQSADRTGIVCIRTNG